MADFFANTFKNYIIRLTYVPDYSRHTSMTGADWPVGQFGRMPEGPAVRREKVCESMETFAFLSISAH